MLKNLRNIINVFKKKIVVLRTKAFSYSINVRNLVIKIEKDAREEILELLGSGLSQVAGGAGLL